MTTLFAAIEKLRPEEGTGQRALGALDTRTRPEGYRLPHDVADRLKGALASYKNGEGAMALAVFLARYWSSRARMVRPFPIDRRALADHSELGLTEARIRGAIKTLEEVGFLYRGLVPAGSVHKLVATGELHRKPITFGFGSDYGPLFAAANARAERARLRRQGRAVQGAPIVRSTARRPVQVPKSSSPKDKERSGYVVIMGEVTKKGSSEEPGVSAGGFRSALEEALARLELARRSHVREA